MWAPRTLIHSLVNSGPGKCQAVVGGQALGGPGGLTRLPNVLPFSAQKGQGLPVTWCLWDSLTAFPGWDECSKAVSPKVHVTRNQTPPARLFLFVKVLSH